MRISIASGKGGTGKTTLSTNLASYLAEKSEVILVDLDVEEPNSRLFIEAQLVSREEKYTLIPEWVRDKCTLCGICQQSCNFNAIIQLDETIEVFPQLCHSCFACSELCPEEALPMIPQKIGELRYYKNSYLHFVESRLDIGQEQAVPLIAKTNDYVHKNFPGNIIRIFDSPPGTSCPVIEATKTADLVILVTEPTPFGLHDLKLAVDTMKQLNKSFGVVINRIGIGNDEVLSYCNKENIPVIGKIPNDRRIAELYSRGELIYKSIPKVEQQLKQIENYLLKMKK